MSTTDRNIRNVILLDQKNLPKHQKKLVSRIQRKLADKHLNRLVDSFLGRVRLREAAAAGTLSMGCAVDEPSCSQCEENTHGEEFGVRLANMTDPEKTAISMAGMDIINREREVGRLLPVQQLPDNYFTDHETIAYGSTGNS